MNTSLKRCGWVNMKNDLYVHYHDKEWGGPVHDENKLFEMLLLESSQAGLSWEIILNPIRMYLIILIPIKLPNMIVKNKIHFYKIRELSVTR